MGGFGDAFGDDLFITDLTVLGMTHCFLPHRSHPRSNAHPEVPQNTAGVGTSKTDSPADITPVLANKVGKKWKWQQHSLLAEVQSFCLIAVR